MQSIIVYRNPLEAMIWGQLMEGEFGLVIIAAGVLSVLAAIAVNAALEKTHPRTRYSNKARALVVIVAVVVFAATVKILIG